MRLTQYYLMIMTIIISINPWQKSNSNINLELLDLEDLPLLSADNLGPPRLIDWIVREEQNSNA